MFTSLLALGAAALAVAVLAGWRSAAGTRPSTALMASIGDAALWIAFLVAGIAMAGSLYFSEVADFIPCRLCWFQRIAMYPLAVILLVAAIRRDRAVRWYVVPVAAIGACVSMYHYVIEWNPELEVGDACAATGPACSGRVVPRVRLRHAVVHGAVRFRRDHRAERRGDAVAVGIGPGTGRDRRTTGVLMASMKPKKSSLPPPKPQPRQSVEVGQASSLNGRIVIAAIVGIAVIVGVVVALVVGGGGDDDDDRGESGTTFRPVAVDGRSPARAVHPLR